jgi:plastocyanin
MVRSRNGLAAIGGTLALLGAAMVGGSMGLAQDATPAAGGAGHSAHIHAGTCDDLNPAPRFLLADVRQAASTGTPPAGRGAPIAVATSVTTVEAPLAELVAGGYAINVHAGQADIQTYDIACGDIGGATAIEAEAGGGGRLTIGLREHDGSGYSGIAVLAEAGARTEVTIYLARGLAGEPVATGEAAPVFPGGDAIAVAVTIAGFRYDPDPVEIAVGEAVTWTNLDGAPHTATARDRGILQSGTLRQGERFTETFETAGTYEYFCEFHAGMQGTVVVR